MKKRSNRIKYYLDKDNPDVLIRSSQNNAFCILIKGASHWMTLPIGSIYKNLFFGKSKRAVEITASKAADISKGMLKNDEGIACGKIIRKLFHLDKGNVKPKSDLQNKNEIIFYEDSDKFSLKTANGREKDFFLDWNRAGAKWVTLFGIRDDYKEMVSLIENDTDTIVLANDKELNDIEYIRSDFVFLLRLITVSDPWINPWDDVPYIELSMVGFEDPNFDIYADEALRWDDFLDARRASRQRKVQK